MTINESRDLPYSYFYFLNSLIISYTETYQDIPLKRFFNMELDSFYEDLVRMMKLGPRMDDHIHKLKNHLISFQEERSNLKQEHVPYPIRYISAKEFYWAISEFYLGENHSVSKKFLFTELLYMRHILCTLTMSTTDLTLDCGKTYFSKAVHGYYEKYGNRFGTNGHLFYPEDLHITVYPILKPLHADIDSGQAIEGIDELIEKEFGFYKILKEAILNLKDYGL